MSDDIGIRPTAEYIVCGKAGCKGWGVTLSAKQAHGIIGPKDGAKPRKVL